MLSKIVSNVFNRESSLYSLNADRSHGLKFFEIKRHYSSDPGKTVMKFGTSTFSDSPQIEMLLIVVID